MLEVVLREGSEEDVKKHAADMEAQANAARKKVAGREQRGELQATPLGIGKAAESLFFWALTIAKFQSARKRGKAFHGRISLISCLC